MYKGDRSRKETLVEYGFRLPSALDNRPLKFEEWEQLAPQTIFVSATPGPYERRNVGADGRAARAAHGPRRSGSRDPPGAHAGRRRAVRDQRCASRNRRARADHDAHQAHGRGSHGVPARARRARCATCTRTSRRSSAPKSSAICDSASSTCWSASTCCAKVSTCPRCRWSRSWMRTRKASCVRRAR